MKKIFFILSLTLSAPSQAMYFSSYIYEMNSKEDFISKYITNDTETRNLYNIHAYAIEKPSNTNEVKLNISDKEILYAPLRKVIDAQATDIFKIFYRGPKDSKERYYRVVFTETPLTTFGKNEEQRSSTYLPSISLSTILIVRPKNQKFEYKIDEKSGIIKNTGNTFFRAIIHNDCHTRDEDADHVYILPSEEYQNDLIKQPNKNKIFLIIDKKYIPIVNRCEIEKNNLE